MTIYKLKFRITGHREIDTEAASPDAAALAALAWKADPRLGCWVDGAQIDPTEPDITVYDSEGRTLLRLPNLGDGATYIDEGGAVEEVEGASDDSTTERRR